MPQRHCHDIARVVHFIGRGGKLSLPSSIALVSTGTGFLPYSGTMPVSFRARTSPGGGATITLQVSGEFSPANGPTVAGGRLRYTCSGATQGTSCAGQQTATTTAQTPVLTIPASACTGGGGACAVTLVFQFTDRWRYIATGAQSCNLNLSYSVEVP
ncbi:MAG: hypothetical protein FJW20_23430 [Acidimicrobiia bacterium]|nr:hypothetical protein [Acidimicrobiia bacterium]